MSGKGWIGVDLDGTLAHYDVWRGETHIGEPIIPMVERVKKMLEDGVDVRIFTARVYEPMDASGLAPEPITRRDARQAIEAWCLKHIGRVLPVTNIKDYAMVTLYDDRAIQVIQNTGILVRAPDGVPSP